MTILVQIHSLLELYGLSLKQQLEQAISKLGSLVDGFEIFLFPDYVFNDYKTDENQVVEMLSQFSYNAVHLFGQPKMPLGRNEWTRQCFERIGCLAPDIVRLVVVHPDTMVDPETVIKLSRHHGVKIGAEILGKTASSFNTMGEMEALLECFPDLQFIVDTAHLEEIAITGQPPLEVWLDRFRDRLGHIHFSVAGNLYKDVLGMEDIQAPHSLANLKWERAVDYLPCIERLSAMAFTVEGVVPNGPAGDKMILREIELLRAADNQPKDG